MVFKSRITKIAPAVANISVVSFANLTGDIIAELR